MLPPPNPHDQHRPEQGVVWFENGNQSREAAKASWYRWENVVGAVATFLGLVLLAVLARDVARGNNPLDLQPTAEVAPASFLPLTPTTLEVVPGSDAAVAVRAMGPDGAALGDTLVEFRVESGGVLLSSEMARTSAVGVAQTTVRIPPQPGSLAVTAVLRGSELSPVTFSLVSLAAPTTTTAARVALLAGDRQQAGVAALLPAPIAIRVTDATGNPVADAEVRFESLTGGAVAPARARTDAQGRATARWRLGPTAGEQRLAAVVPTAPDQFVTFTAFATAPVVADSEAAGAAPLAAPPANPVAAAAAESAPVTVAPSPVALGGTHACVLSAGAAACRGANDRGQRGESTAGDFIAVASGVAHVCALDRAGVASCWGANPSGQLGDGGRTDRRAPVPVDTQLRFATLAAGQAFTCGLTAGGRAACWGQNLNGQLGDGSREDRGVPQMVAGERSFRALVAGWNHACGVTASGEAFCWGVNGQGQIGDGTRADRLTPTPVAGAFQQLVAGSAHTCGLSAGQVLCWGGNGFGQLGDGSTTGRPAPVAVAGLPGPATELTAGAVHTCALVDGAAYCWGQNLYGQLGDGTTQNRSTPVRVAGTVAFSNLYAGGALTCARGTDGAQYCWGLNQSGQLGDGSRQNRSVPTRVGG